MMLFFYEDSTGSVLVYLEPLEPLVASVNVAMHEHLTHTVKDRLLMIQSGNFEPGHSVEKAIKRFWMSFAGYVCPLYFVRSG